jgi:drug/metabolite transporter (DMT)-like permease
MTSAAQGSFIHKTMFLYVIILAVIFLKEKINKYFILGAILLLIGNLILIKNLSFYPNMGDVLIFIATIFWAIENVFSKYMIKTVKSDIVAWARMFFGAIFIFVYLSINGQVVALNVLDFGQISWLLISSIFLFGYVITWYRSLAKIPVSLATSILLLGSPVTTSLFFISGQKLSLLGVSSAIFILFGAAIIIIFGYGNIKNERKEIFGN